MASDPPRYDLRIAVEIQNDQLVRLRRYVPRNHLLAIGRVEDDFFGLRKARLGRCGVRRNGGVEQRALKYVQRCDTDNINRDGENERPFQESHARNVRHNQFHWKLIMLSVLCLSHFQPKSDVSDFGQFTSDRNRVTPISDAKAASTIPENALAV